MLQYEHTPEMFFVGVSVFVSWRKCRKFLCHAVALEEAPGGSKGWPTKSSPSIRKGRLSLPEF